jgi:hypothetical protein
MPVRWQLWIQANQPHAPARRVRLRSVSRELLVMKQRFAAVILALLAASPAMASSCIMPTARADFAASDVVVAAEVRGISITRAPGEPGKFRQTILWRVHESWKGRHPSGRDFTTRTLLNCPRCTFYRLKPGQLMILYLSGREPYQLDWCRHSNRLEYSIKDIPLLYKLSVARDGT